MNMSIHFPNLNLSFDHVIRSFWILGTEITLYGIMVALGLLVAVLFIILEAKRTHQNSNEYLGMILFALTGGVIGARLYYVGCQWLSYKDNTEEILNIRNGGMAFYGALFGGILFAAIFCKIRKLVFGQMADTIVVGLLAGQIIGKIGVFFSREGFGGFTENIVAMQLPVSSVRAEDITDALQEQLVNVNGVSCIQVHPLFLYDCLWCLILLLFVLAMKRRKRFQGELFMYYLSGYALGHVFIEGLRTDKLLIAGTRIPISMILSIFLTFFFGVTVIVQRTMAKKRAEARKRREQKYLEREQQMLREQAEAERAREAMEEWKKAHTAKGKEERKQEDLERRKRAQAALEERQKFRESIEKNIAHDSEKAPDETEKNNIK